MPERRERLLLGIRYVLIAVLTVQLLGMIVRRNPLADLIVPVPPKWNLATSGANLATSGTNLATSGTNLATSGTNLATSGTNLATSGTNLTASGTNLTASGTYLTASGTNLTASGTNLTASGTNLTASGTNLTASGTNLAAVSRSPRPPGMRGGPPGNPGSRPGPALPLAPLVQARIDRITQSELLAPVFRPPPMALLGIAGLDAFIRTPNGQSTMLREGGQSDGVKLLRLGTNRVLIEQAGERKELTIFNGLGSESLLSK